MIAWYSDPSNPTSSCPSRRHLADGLIAVASGTSIPTRAFPLPQHPKLPIVRDLGHALKA